VSEAMSVRWMVSEVDLMSFWQYVVSWRKVRLLTGQQEACATCVQGKMMMVGWCDQI
jgi:hypothetical protein